MKTKYFLPFLGFGLVGNQITQAQTSKDDTKQVRLLPPKSFYNAWSTGTTLTQYALEIDGPVNLDLKSTLGEDGFIEYGDYKKVKEAFKKTNDYFKTDSARAKFDLELNQYPLLPGTLNHILDDGKILSKEELDSLNNLKDGDYLFTFYYKTKDYNNPKADKKKKQSIPGIAVIKKHGSNFDYNVIFGEKKDVRDSTGINKEKRLRTRFGLEAAIGTNKEKVLGAFLQVPITSGLGLEAYADYYIVRGNHIFSNEETKVTARDRQLIGPGTYKQRTDEITTYTIEDVVAEAGLGPVLRIKDFEFPLRVGVNLSEEEKKLYGKATIVHERNMQLLGDPQVITNTKYGGKKSVYNLALSAGAYYNISKNLSAGISFNKVREKNSGRFNVRYKF